VFEVSCFFRKVNAKSARFVRVAIPAFMSFFRRQVFEKYVFFVSH
jgi:hypothetical protein